MKYTPDFTEAAGPIEAGEYRCKLLSVEGRESKAGSHYLNWKVSNHKGHIFYYITMLSGPGSFRLKELIQATINPGYQSGEFDADEMVGRSLMMDLGLNSYNGKPQFQVIAAWAIPDAYAGQDPEPVSPDSYPTQPTPPAVKFTEDDIPF